jgi:hypothetical protein
VPELWQDRKKVAANINEAIAIRDEFKATVDRAIKASNQPLPEWSPQVDDKLLAIFLRGMDIHEKSHPVTRGAKWILATVLGAVIGAFIGVILESSIKGWIDVLRKLILGA